VRRWAWSDASLLILLAACDRPRSAEPKLVTVPPVSAPAPTSPDRLPPGELLEGEERVFGLPIPRDMKLESFTRRTAEAKGRVRPEALGDYLRQRVLVNHVEMAERRLVFPRVQLRGDQSATILQLEVVDDGLETRLLVRNLTGAVPLEGLSDEERWKRAGLKRGGQLIDPQNWE